MNSIFWLFLLVVTAVIGNMIIRKVVKRIERTEYKPIDQPYEDSRDVELEGHEILLKWGKRGQNYTIPSYFLPLHERFQQLLSNYCELYFDPIIKIYDRKFAEEPYHAHPEFLQIGVWGDGSEIFIRLQSEDPNVYILSVEDGDIEYPDIFANTLSEYLVMAMEDYEESNKILEKKGFKLT